MRAAFCRGGYGALLAFSMSAFARWFAVRLVQALVWLRAHIEPMSMPVCSSAAAASPAGVPRDALGCARAGATVAAALPAVAPPRLLGGFAGNGRRFRHGFGLLCGFRRGSFAVDFADLGKRRRVVVFRADLACETAQKSQAGLKVAHLDMCSGPVGAGRKHCDCRAVCVDAPSASRGMEGCSGNERSFFARLLRIVLRDALISRAISATESPCFLS